MARKPLKRRFYKSVRPVNFSWIRRIWLRLAAEWATRTYGGLKRFHWRDPWRNDLHGFNAFFVEAAPLFGDFVLSHWGIPKPVARKLASLGQDNPPFVHLGSVFTNGRGRLWLPYSWAPSKLAAIHEDNWYSPLTKRMQHGPEAVMCKLRFNIRAAALVSATGTKLLPRLTTSGVFRDYLSEPTGACSEETQFSEGWDLPRRFRTIAPEMPLALNGGRKAAPRFIVMTCVENTRAEPVFLIAARDLIASLGEEEKRLLRADDFTFFDNWNPSTLWRTRAAPKAVLYDVPSPDNPGISYDANRIDPAALESSSEKRHAVLHLISRIEELEKSGCIYKVMLKTGDALVIDNYRTLVLGLESGRVRMWWGVALRWLRAFHGYSQAED